VRNRALSKEMTRDKYCFLVNYRSFAQDFGSGLAPTQSPQFQLSKSAENGVGGVSRTVVVDDLPHCPNQISIIAEDGLDVCDGGHRCL
jgi:hypothetical protein